MDRQRMQAAHRDTWRMGSLQTLRSLLRQDPQQVALDVACAPLRVLPGHDIRSVAEMMAHIWRDPAIASDVGAAAVVHARDWAEQHMHAKTFEIKEQADRATSIMWSITRAYALQDPHVADAIADHMATVPQALVDMRRFTCSLEPLAYDMANLVASRVHERDPKAYLGLLAHGPWPMMSSPAVTDAIIEQSWFPVKPSARMQHGSTDSSSASVMASHILDDHARTLAELGVASRFTDPVMQDMTSRWVDTTRVRRVLHGPRCGQLQALALRAKMDGGNGPLLTLILSEN